jgi:hypothetical protein
MISFKLIHEAMKKAKRKNLQLTLEKCFDIEIDKKLNKQQNYDLLMNEFKELYTSTNYKYIDSVNDESLILLKKEL